VHGIGHSANGRSGDDQPLRRHDRLGFEFRDFNLAVSHLATVFGEHGLSWKTAAPFDRRRSSTSSLVAAAECRPQGAGCRRCKGVWGSAKEATLEDFEAAWRTNALVKTKSPQTNGFAERFHKTVLNEFYRIALS
jgi:hypothetical protein